MPNKNKIKGTRHEKWMVDWLRAQGIEAKRQPLSGSLGGEYSGDIILNLMGHRLVGEVKYRDLSGFPSPFTVLTERDIAFYKRRRGTPQLVVVMSGETFQRLMEKNNDGEPKTTDS
jgi:Holliday junction resolvase